MYSIVLTTLMSVGTATPDFGWRRNGSAGCQGCSGYSGGYGMVVEMPAGCGCSPGGMPGFGGMPMVAPPMADMGMPPAPPGGMVLPPAQIGETVQPPGMPPMTPPSPALGEARTSPNQVMFVVTLPADARLLADGTVIPGTGTVRVFMTPPLDPVREYFYELAIEVDRGGKILRDQQTVKFQAGKTANVSFAEPKAETPPPPPAGPMPKTARIRVRVPAGAALYVEGRPWAVPAVIQTPLLDPGQTHYYQLRVEVVRDGRRAVATREVAFRAGQELTVDFTADPAHVAKNSR